MLQNPAVVTGGTLVAGALTDGNQALSLSSSGVFDVPDSTSSSLAITDGTAGGLSLMCWFKVPSLPSSTQTILGKVGSYELKLTAAGRLQWVLTNGANSVTVTSAASIQTNRFYHFAGVYNGDYSGTPVVGTTTVGNQLLPLPADQNASGATGGLNLHTNRVAMQEQGKITQVVAYLQRGGDVSSPEWIAPVVYRDGTSLDPGALAAQGDPQLIYPSARTPTAYTFTIDANVYAGPIHLGLVGGAEFGLETSTISIASAATGGVHKYRACSVSSSDGSLTGTVPDPFGAVFNTDTINPTIYANYTPTGRTGAEGQALIYLDGVLDSFSSYTHGIADSSSNLQHPTGLAVVLDEVTIWNKKLTAEQIALDYSVR